MHILMYSCFCYCVRSFLRTISKFLHTRNIQSFFKKKRVKTKKTRGRSPSTVNSMTNKIIRTINKSGRFEEYEQNQQRKQKTLIANMPQRNKNMSNIWVSPTLSSPKALVAIWEPKQREMYYLFSMTISQYHKDITCMCIEAFMYTK